MIQNNQDENKLRNERNLNSNLGDIEENQQVNDSSNTIKVGNTTFTQEEIEAANKPQPNVITDTVDVNRNVATGYRDPERVNQRSNEAPDSTDTNTGEIIAGAAKGTAQS